MKRIIYFSLLLSGMAAQSQTFQWLEVPTTEISFNSDMVGYSVTNDPTGNVYFCGFKDEPFVYNDIMGNLYYNKYDSSGQLLFSKIIGGKACNHNMASDSQGNIIMALGYVENITIDGLAITTTEQGDHYLLAKFDAEGNLLWHRLIITEEEFTWTSELSAVALDTEDNIYIGYGNFMDCFIDKYSPDGTKVLTVTQENVSRITSVAIDTEGNIYAAGSCADNNAVFGGMAVAAPFQYNTYLVKYSAQGQYQWVKCVDDITCPAPQVVARTPDEVYFTSFLFGAYTFGEHTTEGPESGMFEDFFLAKLDASGTYQWVREVPGNGRVAQGNRNFLNMDNSGNVYFAGYTSGAINWGNGITTNAPAMGRDIIVLKYSPEGVVQMAKTAGGEWYDRADGLSVNSDGDIYLSGLGNGPGTFDSLEHEAGAGENYPYLAKISSSTAGVHDPQANGILLYPNPADDRLYLSGVDKTVRGSIVNMLGQNVADFEADSTSPIAIHQLPAGTYFIKAEGLPVLRFIKK